MVHPVIVVVVVVVEHHQLDQHQIEKVDVQYLVDFLHLHDQHGKLVQNAFTKINM